MGTDRPPKSIFTGCSALWIFHDFRIAPQRLINLRTWTRSAGDRRPGIRAAGPSRLRPFSRSQPTLRARMVFAALDFIAPRGDTRP
jgi:hypothetical protein